MITSISEAYYLFTELPKSNLCKALSYIKFFFLLVLWKRMSSDVFRQDDFLF